MKQVIVATLNKGKAVEFKEFFLEYQIDALSLVDLAENLPDVEETGETFSENAKLKAEQIADILKVPVLADDSGLVIDALDGRPGIYSARYAGEEKSDFKNNEKVLEELIDIPAEKRTARFVCVLAIVILGEETIFKTGKCEGRIAFSKSGNNGFGYDPIFIPDGYDKSMAELPSKIKNQISHRSNAIVQLGQWIKKIV